MFNTICIKFKKLAPSDDNIMLFLIALLLIAAVSFVTMVIVVYSNSMEDILFPNTLNNSIATIRSEWGQFGDFFGGVLNPLFGFLSFFALLMTILYQARSLRNSSEELKLSREELSKSSSALAAQNKAIELQSFEQTFFSWLNAYSSLLGAIKYEQRISNTPHTINGRSALNKFWENYLEHLTNSQYPIDLSNPSESIDVIKKAWESLYKEEEYQLDSLFRTLYRLFLWIDSQHESRLAQPQKWLYVSIVRGQLSWIEMVYLYYNGLSARGKKFKVIVEKYALFDNLTFDSNIGIEFIKNHLPTGEFYSCEAFDSELARVKLGLPKSSEETLALATTASYSHAAPSA